LALENTKVHKSWGNQNLIEGREIAISLEKLEEEN
jgi:hypothetical protein